MRRTMKKKMLDPKYIHIGLVRYAGWYHASNEASADRLKQLEEKLHCEFDQGCIPRSIKIHIARLALEHGFQLHFFEKGLGR